MQEKELTLFYLKDTGEITGFCTGHQSMDYFGENKKIYSKIIDFIIVENDEFIIRNRDYYKVKNKKLVFEREV